MTDSPFDSLKTKGFWLFILIGSITGALISIILSLTERKPVVLGHGYICPENSSFKESLPTIKNPEDSVANYDYSRLFSGESDRARFKGFLVSIGNRMPITGYDSANGMTKIYSEKYETEGWIYNGDIKKEPCK